MSRKELLASLEAFRTDSRSFGDVYARLRLPVPPRLRGSGAPRDSSVGSSSPLEQRSGLRTRARCLVHGATKSVPMPWPRKHLRRAPATRAGMQGSGT